ncbi:RE1-silencing transcription factor isoform X2 [Betta splendens]|uniref:RE1-silencing transcription factor isoform X2 n=1 Tax=Betta splendens TaxID=158456 RepID=A0A6P7NTE9_BETSP|nr:RE1-silencing transcription factor isoform X2 [Betta splendens]XP_055368388.1 RE1-silencing transcription factor isoform X2 [Betta splendens]
MWTKLKTCLDAPAFAPQQAPKHLNMQLEAQNEQEFVEHLSTHSISKMMVVNRVEGHSKTRTKESETSEIPSGGEGEASEDAVAAGDVKGLIRCERCGYNTNRYDHYIAHLKHHSKEGEDHRVFKCTLCPYTTVSQYHWRKHLRNHFPSKLHTCSQCSYFSDRKSNYIQHIRTHTGVRPFQCPYCDYSSSQKTHLTRHMRTHSGERPFKCESCNYLAANQHEVTRHARQVHNGPKPLSCPYCEYKTADRSNFKKHVELHLNPRQFLCPLCKYAASKKCNLQYHIKSRHSGCNVPVDVSKVKLRIKKPGPEGAEDNSESKATKFDNSATIEDKFDIDNGSDHEDRDFSPINLSIRKNRPSITQAVQSDTPDQAQRKFNPSKTKEKVEPEKKVITRQKKMNKVNQSSTENTSGKEMQTSSVNTDNKGKRRVKKLTRQKMNQDQAGGAQSQKDTLKIRKCDPQGPVVEVVVRQEARDGDVMPRPEKEKEQRKETSGKEDKSFNKPRRSESKKSQKNKDSKDVQQKDRPRKSQKEKSVKRKVVEVLDLSTNPTSKAKRLKATTAEKLKPGPQNTNDMKEAALEKSDVTAPVHQKKTRNSSKRGLLEKTPVSCPSPEAQLDQTKSPAREMGPTAPPSVEIPSTCSSGGATPSAGDVPPAPVFLKPTSPPALTFSSQQTKPTDPEDDEGIHSSHEGGSDISDSASEGSDDSGLHSRSNKMANDPETPTDEIPTPTELKSHMCIFCDRTFPLEVQYRRHLNRHLVNVYYMEGSTAGQK